jgi:hypothetical protein
MSSAARTLPLDIRKPQRTKTKDIPRIEESFTREDTKTTRKKLIRNSESEERNSRECEASSAALQQSAKFDGVLYRALRPRGAWLCHA